MSLAKLATLVQDVKENAEVRDAVVRGDEQLLAAFTAEERTSIQGLAKRLQTGEEMPKHLKLSVSPLLSWS